MWPNPNESFLGRGICTYMFKSVMYLEVSGQSWHVPQSPPNLVFEKVSLSYWSGACLLGLTGWLACCSKGPPVFLSRAETTNTHHYLWLFLPEFWWLNSGINIYIVSISPTEPSPQPPNWRLNPTQEKTQKMDVLLGQLSCNVLKTVSLSDSSQDETFKHNSPPQTAVHV